MLPLSKNHARSLLSPLLSCLLAGFVAGCGDGRGGTVESGSTTGETIEAGSITGGARRGIPLGGGIRIPGDIEDFVPEEPFDAAFESSPSNRLAQQAILEQLANVHASLDESRRLLHERDCRPAPVSEQHRRAEGALNGAAEVSRARMPAGESYTIVNFRNTGQEVVQTLPQLMQLDNLRQIVFRPRQGNPPIDDELSALSHLGDLVSLRFEYAKIGPRGYEHLSQLSHIEEIEFHNCWVTDADFQCVKGLPRLRKLSFSGANDVTDAGLSTLFAHRQLEEVRFKGLSISDAGLAALRNNLGLRLLEVVSNQITEDGVIALISGDYRLPIEELTLSNCQVTGLLMSHLQSRPLKRLSLGRAAIRNDDLRHLGRSSSLKELKIRSSREETLTSEGLKHLSLLDSLRVLELDVAHVDPADFRYLRRLDSLETLALDHVILDDVAIAYLARLAALQELYGVERVKLSAEGIRNLPLLVRLRSVAFSASTQPTNRELLALNELPNLRQVYFFDGRKGVPSDQVRDELAGVTLTIHD